MDQRLEARGQFIPCACCGKVARFGRSTVQDHQTKGDQPFQALVAKQMQIQPANAVKASRFAPLRGRKVLVFSDSRQVAARLAPNLQMYSTRDSLRSLIAWGYSRLQKASQLKPLLSLDDLYIAILLASSKLSVRLRPELKPAENFAAAETVQLAIDDGSADTEVGLLFLLTKMRSETPPQALLEDLITTVSRPVPWLRGAGRCVDYASAAKSQPSWRNCQRSPDVIETRRGQNRARPGMAEMLEKLRILAQPHADLLVEAAKDRGRERQGQEGQGKIRRDGYGHRGQSRAQDFQ